MAEPELHGTDIFHIIGFSREDVSSGLHFAAQKLFTENLNAGMSLHRKLGPLGIAEQRGLVALKLVEVYFLDPYAFFDDDTFEKRFGTQYQVVDFYNQPALELSARYGIKLPATIDKTTRAELPERLGTSMRFIGYFAR